MQFPIIPAHAMTVHVCRRARHFHLRPAPELSGRDVYSAARARRHAGGRRAHPAERRDVRRGAGLCGAQPRAAPLASSLLVRPARRDPASTMPSRHPPPHRLRHAARSARPHRRPASATPRPRCDSPSPPSTSAALSARAPLSLPLRRPPPAPPRAAARAESSEVRTSFLWMAHKFSESASARVRRGAADACKATTKTLGDGAGATAPRAVAAGPHPHHRRRTHTAASYRTRAAAPPKSAPRPRKVRAAPLALRTLRVPHPRTRAPAPQPCQRHHSRAAGAST